MGQVMIVTESVVGIGDRTVKLVSNEERLADWLTIFEAPVLDPASRPEDSESAQILILNPRVPLSAGLNGLMDQIRREISIPDESTGFFKLLGQRYMDRCGSVRFVEPMTGDEYVVQPQQSRFMFYSRFESQRSFTEAMRFVRLVLAKLGEVQGYLGLHAAGVSIGGKGVLIGGGKFAGKTTAVLSLCLSGQADLLSNDKCLVRAGGPCLHSVSWPLEGMLVGLGSLAAHATRARDLIGGEGLVVKQQWMPDSHGMDLHPFRNWYSQRKLFLTPQEIETRLGIRRSPQITVELFLFPNLRPYVQAPSAIPLTTGQLVRNVDNLLVSPIASEMPWPGAFTRELDHSRRHFLKCLEEHVIGVELRFGPNTQDLLTLVSCLL